MTFSVRTVSLESVSLKCFTQLCISETGNISWLVDFKFPQFEFLLIYHSWKIMNCILICTYFPYGFTFKHTRLLWHYEIIQSLNNYGNNLTTM